MVDDQAFRELTEGAAAVRFSPRAVLRVSGERPLDFLDAVCTQEVAGLGPGRGALACLLDATGHVLAELRVLPMTRDEVLVDAEEAALETLRDHLGRIAPLSGCEVVDDSWGWGAIAIRGPKAETALLGLGEVPAAEHAFRSIDGAIVARVEWGLAGFDLLMPVGERVLVEAVEVGRDAWEAARIAAGRPRFGIDITPEHIVNETPLVDRALSPAKGCYPGQETVARIRNLGRPRRAVVGLRLSGEDPPEPGAPVRAGDAEVGRVTSAARTPEGPVAIATVRSEHAADGARLEAGGVPATVRRL